MKIVTIIGARPQFIKAAVVSREIIRRNRTIDREAIREIIVHTGQHYDANMSKIFFEELDIPEPGYHLEIGNMSHGAMTGRMIEHLEVVLIKEQPDYVLIYGDTNSTLAAIITAAKLQIPVAHVEAGLRSFNRTMPEEINRIVADRLSALLFCPTDTAVENLRQEGIVQGVHNIGDVMFDAVLFYRDRARETVSLAQWGIEDRQYVLCTVHRAENTNDFIRLTAIFEALQAIAREMPVILPLHPRTRNLLADKGREDLLSGLTVIAPVSYLEMARLEMSASLILTDSGGMQKEAFFHNVPCLTLRDETEWIETVTLGANRLCGANKELILREWGQRQLPPLAIDVAPYGDGHAAGKIVDVLLDVHGEA